MTAPKGVWYGLYPKAKENLGVGARCMVDGHCNAAASRLYYSAFQAAAWALACAGMSPQSITADAMTWNHTMVRQNLGKILSPSTDRTHLRNYLVLKALREKADYAPEDVSKGELGDLDQGVRDLHLRLGL